MGKDQWTAGWLGSLKVRWRAKLMGKVQSREARLGSLKDQLTKTGKDPSRVARLGSLMIQTTMGQLCWLNQRREEWLDS